MMIRNGDDFIQLVSDFAKEYKLSERKANKLLDVIRQHLELPVICEEPSDLTEDKHLSF